jgi:predicted MPP superfamily phosphohydrolase
MRLVLPLVMAVVLAAAILAVVMYRNALATPVVAPYDVTVPGWTGAPLRVVQLSDIHMGVPDMPATRVAALVRQVNALHPDLVALTGDYHDGKLIDRPSGNLDDAVRPLRELRSRLGTFAVRGNHDEPYWTPRVLPRYGMTYLQNSHADAGPVVVAGVDDLSTGSPDIAAALAGITPGKPVILLMHEPDGFAGVPPSVALTLAGHTHGGQVRLPLLGALLTNTRLGYVRGRYVVGGRTLIVSSGVGTSGLPIRLGVPPEIVVVTLHAPR